MAGVQVGRPGTKSVGLTINVWYDEKLREIFLTSPDVHGFVVSVNNNEDSINRHQNLYNKLRQVLQESGRWPASAAAESTTTVPQPEA